MSLINENNSIFHHTSSMTNLVHILTKQAFKVQYCTERIYVSKNTGLHIAVPMVSFADIRLTDYVRSFKMRNTGTNVQTLGYYGDFAIGLTKEWAIKKNIVPIVYVPKPLSSRMLPANHFLSPLVPYAVRSITANNLGKTINLPPIASFCKHYVGVLENKPGIRVEYAFHNEQEWRYVPSDLTIRWNYYNSMSDPTYSIQKQKKINVNKRLKRTLDFSIWEDVSFVVVKSEAFVKTIVGIYDKIKQSKLNVAVTQQERDKINNHYTYLCSCIITTEQLCSAL